MEIPDQALHELEKMHGEKRVASIGESRVIVFPSSDFAKIRELCLHPRIYPHITDDFSSKDFKMGENPNVRYLLCRDDEGVFGFVIFIAITGACWGAHVAFLPRAYGAGARRAFQLAIEWMWANTAARRITGEILRTNTLAIRFARSAGFQMYGINKKSKLIGGVMRDQVCMGISKLEKSS
jgi:hypothetical protein